MLISTTAGTLTNRLDTLTRNALSQAQQCEQLHSITCELFHAQRAFSCAALEKARTLEKALENSCAARPVCPGGKVSFPTKYVMAFQLMESDFTSDST